MNCLRQELKPAAHELHLSVHKRQFKSCCVNSKSWRSQIMTAPLSNHLSEKVMNENKLVDLSKQFAIDIVDVCTKIKESRKDNVLINQLLRSGTSI